MRLTLPESHRRAAHSPARRRAGALASVAAHVAVATLAVVATGRAASAPREPEAAEEPVVFVAPRPEPVVAPAPRAPAAPTAPPSGPALPTLPDVPTVDASVLPTVSTGAPAVPALPLVASAVALDRFVDGVAVSGAGSGAPAGGTPPGDAPYAAHVVERAAAPLPGARPPRYPESLRSAGVQGTAVLRFVVDTLGRVERGSVEVLRTDHPLFAAAARAAVEAVRFRPAEVAGRPVRQLVGQPFAFTLDR